MNKRIPLLLLSVFALAGCAKTKLLYDEHAYNYVDFDKNYFVEWEDIKNLNCSNETKIAKTAYTLTTTNNVYIGERKIDNCVWIGDDDKEFGYKNNLSNIEKKFSYGITSKLFDGRVWCDLLYQKSRVQLNSSGFAMYFPKSLRTAKYLGFACRGGSNLPDHAFSHSDLNIDVTWTFYLHNEDGTYNKIIYLLNDVKIPVDNGGVTTFVNFLPYMGDNFDELAGAVAMSFEWNADDVRLNDHNLTDDFNNKEKSHLALMLYEIFIGDSTWY